MNFHSLLPGGCVKHRVKRGLIIDAARSASVSWTPGIAGNRRRWTLSLLIKQLAPALYTPIFDADNSGNDFINIGNSVAGELMWVANFSAAPTLNLRAASLMRDPTAWRHMLFSLDTPHVTAAERARMFDNSQQITNFTAAVYPALNAEFRWNNTGLHQLGKERTNYSHLMIAEVHFIDGEALDPDDFGHFDPKSGTFAPKRYLGSYGANGRYYPLVGDAGDAPATATEGLKDRAPIEGAHIAANNATANNLAVSDFVKDTPTNFRSGSDYRGNFATWSPIGRTGNASFGICPLADGNLKASPTSALSALATFALPKSGKRYWEIEFNAGGFPAHGIGNITFLGCGNATGTFGWYGNGGNGSVHHLGTGSAADANSPNTIGDIALHYVDVSANKYWIGRRRAGVTTWMGGGDPSLGTSPTFSGPGGGGVYSTAMDLSAGTWWPQVSGGGSWTAIANFGQKAFPNIPPANALPLCASSGPRPSVTNPDTAFVQTVKPAASILADLAALRAAWAASYIDILKRYDGVEGWRLRFGDDPANYLDFTETALSKQPFPALAGNYYGCSIRVGSTSGVATGEIAHVNGAATLVNDGVGKTRKVVILRRVDAGGTFPTHHPDATAGELLYMNSTAADAPATDITNVLANSFQIGAGMPSGTYRYLVFAETPGQIAIGKFGGITNADGPTPDFGFAAAAALFKRGDSAEAWYLFDTARETYNPRDTELVINNTGPEQAGPNRSFDFLANGVKARGSGAGTNGGTILYIAFSEAVFAPGECPAQGTAK